MTHLQRHMLPSVLLVVSLVLSACGGGGGKPQDGQGQQDTSGGGQAPAAAATAAAAQGGETEQVSELTKKRRQATFKVVYKWTSSGPSSPANETWYSKPPKSRIDFGEVGQSTRMSQFILPNGAFMCETSSGTSTCWKADIKAASVEELSFTALLFTTYEGLLTDPSFKASRETRTIAGQRGTCHRSSNVIMLGFAEITLCYASNGVPLLFQWKQGADTFTMEATSYSSSVSDKDFDLLAPPQN